MTTTCEVKFYHSDTAATWVPAQMVSRYGNQFICKLDTCNGVGSYHYTEVRMPLTEECKSATQRRLVGLWWYCNDYHDGLDSWQYRVLSSGRYEPSEFATADNEVVDEAQDYYNKLIDKFETFKYTHGG